MLGIAEVLTAKTAEHICLHRHIALRETMHAFILSQLA